MIKQITMPVDTEDLKEQAAAVRAAILLCENQAWTKTAKTMEVLEVMLKHMSKLAEGS